MQVTNTHIGYIGYVVHTIVTDKISYLLCLHINAEERCDKELERNFELYHEISNMSCETAPND